jgi:hypothetical protein
MWEEGKEDPRKLGVWIEELEKLVGVKRALYWEEQKGHKFFQKNTLDIIVQCAKSGSIAPWVKWLGGDTSSSSPSPQQEPEIRAMNPEPVLVEDPLASIEDEEEVKEVKEVEYSEAVKYLLSEDYDLESALVAGPYVTEIKETQNLTWAQALDVYNAPSDEELFVD